MGMDVFGRNPTRDEGRYFRASVWSWRAIYALIMEANQRFALGFDLDGFGWNEGAGLDTQTDSDRLAHALEVILSETDAPTFNLDASPMGAEGVLMAQLAKAGWKVASTPEAIAPEVSGPVVVCPLAYCARREHVEEWIGFLRCCGGFAIC